MSVRKHVTIVAPHLVSMLGFVAFFSAEEVAHGQQVEHAQLETEQTSKHAAQWPAAIDKKNPGTPNARNNNVLTLDLGDGVTMELVLIPAGRFMMGSPEEESGDKVLKLNLSERPQHRVEISRPFYMGKYEVTNAQMRRFRPDYTSGRENSIDLPTGSIEGINLDDDDQPAARVPWDDATAFCEWLTKKSGRHIRLPAEAEWEYACRAGTTTAFHFGATISTNQANYDGRYTYGAGSTGENRLKTTRVGSFPPNAFGLYDMHGNLWEWCSDWYWYGKDREASAPSKEPKGPFLQSFRVLRGGSWVDEPWSCRSATRFTGLPEMRRMDFGFRVVASATP